MVRAADGQYGMLQWCNEHKIRAQTDYIIMAECNHETENLAHRLSVEAAGRVITNIMEADQDYQESSLAPDFLDKINNILQNPESRLCGVGISTCCMVANGNIANCLEIQVKKTLYSNYVV